MDTNQASYSEAAGNNWHRQPVEISLDQLMLLFRPLAQEVVLKQHWGNLDCEQVYEATFICTEYFDQLKKSKATRLQIDPSDYQGIFRKTHLDQQIRGFLSLLRNVFLDLSVCSPIISKY